MDQPVKQERRKHPRYPIQKNEAVVVSPNNIISFCLLDISRIGLAFCYNGSEAEKWLGKKCLLDFLGENFSMESAPVRIIDDLPLDPDNLLLSSSGDAAPNLRRCGVQFLELSKDQEYALKRYIEGISAEYTRSNTPRWS